MYSHCEVKYPTVIKSAQERFIAGSVECDNSAASGTPFIGGQCIEPAAAGKAFTAKYCTTLLQSALDML